jgi:hypothetical protein
MLMTRAHLNETRLRRTLKKRPGKLYLWVLGERGLCFGQVLERFVLVVILECKLDQRP